MRRPAVAFLLLSAAAVVALAIPAAGWANHRAEKKALTPEGQKLAKAMVVRRADVGGTGWRSSPPDEPNDHEERCPGLWDPDLSDLTVVGDARSPDFQSATAFAGSGSSIYKTSQQARAAWRRVLVPGFLKCGVKQIAKGTGGTSSILSAKRLASPPVGAQAAAYRIVVRDESGLRAKLYFDIFAIRRGRGIVGLSFAGIDTPFAGRAVAAAIDRRMIAAGL